jgi:hypothetical protein
MEELCAEKLHNFKQRFLPELLAAGVTDKEIVGLTWQKLCAHLVLGRVFRPVVDAKDMEQLVDMAAVFDDERAMRAWEVWGTMSQEKQQVFWRYAKFFFQCVLGDP